MSDWWIFWLIVFVVDAFLVWAWLIARREYRWKEEEWDRELDRLEEQARLREEQGL